jgi:hypothetical protein
MNRLKFHYLFKNEIIINFFVIFVATKKVGQQIFFPFLFCFCCWIRDSGSGMDKSRDPGCLSRIRNTGWMNYKNILTSKAALKLRGCGYTQT